jgi:hypothetical protein
MNTQSLAVAISALILSLASGCATETRTEREFGDAVRAVNTSQIHDLGAAQYPSKDAITGGNSDRLQSVMESHIDNSGQAGEVKKTIRVGGTSN